MVRFKSGLPAEQLARVVADALRDWHDLDYSSRHGRTLKPDEAAEPSEPSPEWPVTLRHIGSFKLGTSNNFVLVPDPATGEDVYWVNQRYTNEERSSWLKEELTKRGFTVV